jgi:predicted dehydrogenase
MSKLRLIQCGVGGFGGGWVRNHSSKSEDFELAAIVDVSPEALRSAGDDVKIPPERRFSTLEEALEKVPADAVLTVTPPAVHVEHARLAFARGLHVMTEKPIADTLASAREMVNLAEKAGRQLVVSQNYRFNPTMQTLRARLADQTVGEFGHGHIDFYIPADFTGSFRETMEHVLLVDMAIHHLDLVRAVTGRNIVKVYAQTFKPAWSWYQHNPGLKMIMELEGGLPFSYSGDWSGRGRNTDWNGNWRLQCAEGSLNYELGKVLVARSSRGFKADVTVEETPIQPIERTAQTATLKLFADAIRTGKPAEISGQDNLWSFGAVMAGVISAEEGRAVDVSELVRG